MNTKGKKLQLLVNADDFGRHVLIDQAVAQCVEQGCLRSATLMPGGKAFDDAVHTAQTHPELGRGHPFHAGQWVSGAAAGGNSIARDGRRCLL